MNALIQPGPYPPAGAAPAIGWPASLDRPAAEQLAAIAAVAAGYGVNLLYSILIAPVMMALTTRLRGGLASPLGLTWRHRRGARRVAVHGVRARPRRPRAAGVRRARPDAGGRGGEPAVGVDALGRRAVRLGWPAAVRCRWSRRAAGLSRPISGGPGSNVRWARRNAGQPPLASARNGRDRDFEAEPDGRRSRSDRRVDRWLMSPSFANGPCWPRPSAVKDGRGPSTPSCMHARTRPTVPTCVCAWLAPATPASGRQWYR